VLAVANPAPVAYAPQPSQESAFAQESAGPGLSMPQIFAILRAYRMQTLMIVIAISVLMAGIIKLMPKTYTATNTLMVSPEGNDPLANNNQGMATPMFNYMSTESQLMQSPEVLLPVIDRLELTQDKDYTAGYSGDGSNLRDWVREGLVKNLDIQLGAFGSQLIYINASASSAQLAEALM
jgi:uncharacterized protein involved in exopolysaccharide biosynthesis